MRLGACKRIGERGGRVGLIRDCLETTGRPVGVLKVH